MWNKDSAKEVGMNAMLTFDKVAAIAVPKTGYDKIQQLQKEPSLEWQV